MRKYLFILLLPVFAVLITACSEDLTSPNQETGKGDVFIQSTPAGASIFIDSINTNKVTPDTIKNLDANTNKIKLVLDGYFDTSFTITVKKDITTIPPIITLKKQPLGKGNVYIQSDPSGAAIYIDGVNTNRVTPDTIKNLEEGTRNVKLVLGAYTDTSFTVIVKKGMTIVPSIIRLGQIPIIETGSLFIQSTPAGAAIYVDGVNRGVTPGTILNLSTGLKTVKLVLDGYYDTTFTVIVQKDLVTSPNPITLRTNMSVVVYGPIRIYETTGTNSSQLSGLDLSSGHAASLSGGDMDLFYYSNPAGTIYELRSADAHSGSTRKTSFYVSSATNLGDGAASPLSTSSWLTAVQDRTSNYFFAYDDDMHYSKIKIVAVGGGTRPGDPAWIDVQWIYNKVAKDKRFPVMTK